MFIPALAGVLLLLAALPPWLPAWSQSLIMDAFAPTCHQLRTRSLHVGDTALAVCDRCIGIYGGAILGALLGRMAGGFGASMRTRWALLALGAAPAFIDWIGPWLGLWPNTPTSRLLTGLWLGGAVAWMLVQALRSASPKT